MDYPPAGTIFDVLTSHGISLGELPQRAAGLVLLQRLLGRHGLRAARRLAQLGRWLPGVADAVRGNKSFTADLYPLGLARCVRHLRRTEQFFADAAAGTLPAVSASSTRTSSVYSEENPQDIRQRRDLRRRGHQRVMHGPGWPHTLLIWIYDEHGGYYDHVPPPAAVPPDDVPAHNSLLDLRPAGCGPLLRPLFGCGLAAAEGATPGPATYDRYGFRVPAVIVSPYARPDFVLQHASTTTPRCSS